jgi:hypothetical protein
MGQFIEDCDHVPAVWARTADGGPRAHGGRGRNVVGVRVSLLGRDLADLVALYSEARHQPSASPPRSRRSRSRHHVWSPWPKQAVG